VTFVFALCTGYRVGIRFWQILYGENGFRKTKSGIGCGMCEMSYEKYFS